jgi:hypothetical protein
MSRREKILALVILGLGGLFVFDRLLIAPLTESFAAMNERTAQLEAQLTEARALVGMDSKIRRRWEAYRQAGLDRSTEAARIRVQAELSERAADSRFQVATLSSGRVLTGDPYDRLTFSLDGSGTLRQVHDFLYALQAADFPVRVTDCTVVRRRDDDRLTVSMTLSTIIAANAEETAAVSRAGGRP